MEQRRRDKGGGAKGRFKWGSVKEKGYRRKDENGRKEGGGGEGTEEVQMRGL